VYCKKVNHIAKQPQLAEKCGCSTGTIISLENGKHLTNRNIIKKLTEIFAEAGIRFLPEGGLRRADNIVRVFEGEDAYSVIQKDIIKTCSQNKEEVLYLGGDETWSTNKTLKIDKKIYKSGIIIKSLIGKNAKCSAWPKEVYKRIEDCYLLSDLIIIYSDKVIFTVDVVLEPYNCKLFRIKDRIFAEKWRKYFLNLWNNIGLK
jgi:transcriptional regulator with XRE-family HTH domain